MIPKESSTYIPDDIITKWWEITDLDSQIAFYMEHIMPQILAFFQNDLQRMESTGRKVAYDHLISIVIWNALPTLMLANTILPAKLTLIYSGPHKEMLEKYILPNLNTGGIHDIKTVKIEESEHAKNYTTIRSILKQSKSQGEKSLCDIMGGKKISAVMLGMAAFENGHDVVYIDSRHHMREENGRKTNIPVPGEERLYIHKTAGGNIIETEISPDPYNRLIINCDEAIEHIYYQLHSEGQPVKIMQRISADELKALESRLGTGFSRINHKILHDQDTQSEIHGMGQIIQNLLFNEQLRSTLQRSGARGIRLVVDDELAGIPWEIAVQDLIKPALPVVRMFYLDRLVQNNVPENEKTKVLLLSGSCDGLSDFTDTLDSLKSHLSGIMDIPFDADTAESPGELSVLLASNNYRAIFYFGHAAFGATPEETGWICKNGEIFGCSYLERLTGRAPEIIVSNACESARSALFGTNSFTASAIDAGCGTYIGTNWLLEIERSKTFLSRFTEELFGKGKSPMKSFESAVSGLKEKFGEGDISAYNYIYYGR